jgi:hypothetical protein
MELLCNVFNYIDPAVVHSIILQVKQQTTIQLFYLPMVLLLFHLFLDPIPTIFPQICFVFGIFKKQNN